MFAPMDGLPAFANPASDHEWWQTGIIYQVYPRSFADGNGDGIGDLPGLRSRLDYLQGLGVDCLWLSPIYPSPMADFGYDVSDYVGIHPLFGTLADFDALLADVHARGMKLLLDFVPEPHERPAPVVRRVSRSSKDDRQAGLVHLAGPRPRRRAAEQLAEQRSAGRPGGSTPATRANTTSTRSWPSSRT